jgi:hypothetical protein
MLEVLSCYPQKKVHNLYMDSSGRPNIATFDTGNLPSAELDISLARPYNKELIRVSAKVDSDAALV